MIESLIFGAMLLAAFVMGWYLANQQYAPQLKATQDWVLRLIKDYGEVTDTALHMKRDHDFQVDYAHESARNEPTLPMIDGQLGAFIDRIEHAEVRDAAIAQSQKAIMAEMQPAEILDHLRAGEDPLWARAIGD
jgi:hypothetical protein